MRELTQDELDLIGKEEFHGKRDEQDIDLEIERWIVEQTQRHPSKRIVDTILEWVRK